MPKLNSAFRPNTLYCGDCLRIVRGWDDACVDLIYLDPPFNSGANYNILCGNDRAGAARGARAFTAFADTWQWDADARRRVWEMKNSRAHAAHKAVCGLAEMLGETGMLAYLVYMAERLAELRRVLKHSGAIYLHCDPSASHYLKAVMDCIFGAQNFRQEMIWYRYNKIDDKRKVWCKFHDTIFCYSASAAMTWHPLTIGTGEMVTRGKMQKIGGKMVNTGERVTYEKQKCLTRSVIDNIPDIAIGPSKQKLGYPTQKPIALLERIIQTSSNAGDIVLDPFCGCGTTAEAAYKLGRKLIGIDISPYAITRICRDRLKNAKGLSIRGLPTDLNSAREMARNDPFAFERWAVTTLPGFMPNDKQTGDGGIDGRGFMLNPPQGEDGKCVVQVKGGNFSADSMRAMLSKISGGKASMGIFVTLEKCETPTARECIANAGSYKEGAKSFNRMLFWSMAEHFSNARPPLPAMKDPGTGRALQEDLPLV